MKLPVLPAAAGQIVRSYMGGLYTAHRFYSAELDAEAVRLSMSDDRGAEYFAIIEAGGKGWRDRRNAAISTIQQAMQSGWPAGCVAIVPAA